MKLSKALLGAMLAGVAAQTIATTGCSSKAKSAIRPQTENTAPQAENQQPAQAPNPDPNQEPCPACGMG